MRSLLFRGTEPLIVALILAAAVVAVCVVPRVVDRAVGRPPPDERLILAAGDLDGAAFDRALADGASVRGHDAQGVTALMAAASAGYVGRAERLIASGAEVDAGDQWGETPLMFAAATDHADVVRLLLGHGADPGRRDRGGQTALGRAGVNGSVHAAAALADAARVHG